MAGFVVAVTGGVASGKSAATRLFGSLGIEIADADLIARAVVSPGSPTLEKIAARFGPQVLLPDGSLDRAKMRALVFENPTARMDLEGITHPEIRVALHAQCLAATGPYVIAAIPLLAERGSLTAYPWIRRVLVVDAPVNVQRARLMVRDGVDAGLADRMIGAQAARGQRLAIASDVIINDGTILQLQPSVQRLHSRFGTMAADLR